MVPKSNFSLCDSFASLKKNVCSKTIIRIDYFSFKMFNFSILHWSDSTRGEIRKKKTKWEDIFKI